MGVGKASALVCVKLCFCGDCGSGVFSSFCTAGLSGATAIPGTALTLGSVSGGLPFID